MGKKRQRSQVKTKTKPRGGKRFVADSQVFARSRVTNGKDLLPSVDGRSTWARIMRATIQSMFSHLGGEDLASEPQRMMSRRIGAFEAELIHLEDKFARARLGGRDPDIADLDLYSRMSSAQRRLFEAIGLTRGARDITPSLSEYIDMNPDERVRVR